MTTETRRTSSRPARLAAGIAFAVAAVVTVLFLSANPSSAQACDYSGGNADCNGWTFDYFMASDSVTATGLTLNNIEFDGKSVLARANFGGLPVLYDGNACGPYVDLLSTLTNSQPTGVQASTFSQGGQDWLEMGANYQIGQYVLYTAFYFGDSGEMKMRIFARGLQCNVGHEHYPIFVLDVDLEGPNPALDNQGIGDQVLYNSGGNWIQQTSETDNLVSQVGHDWIVRDPDSTMTVAVQADLGVFDPPVGNVFAGQGGADNIIYTRDAGPLREYAWPGAPTNGGRQFLEAADFNGGQWAYNEGEALDDPVVVVRGLLRHEFAPNLPDDWHTAGVSLRVIDDPLGGGPAPTPTAGPTATVAPVPTVPPAGAGCSLINGVPDDGLAGASGDEIRCQVEVPAGSSNLLFAMSGGSGDADLYVRAGTPPTQSTYDCRPYLASNNESCSLTGSGTYHVLIVGYSAFANATLTASWDAPPAAGPFSCSSDGGALTWTNQNQSKYWIYKSTDNGATYSWLGRTLGATNFTDPSPIAGARYQVHYEGIPRTDCATVSEPSAGELFACRADGGVLGWTDRSQSKYWIYKSTDNGATYSWLGRTLGATSFVDSSPSVGARYQVHYAGIPRYDCAIISEPSAGAPFACSADGGTLTWTDRNQSKYWIYRSTDGGATFSWLGRTVGATNFTDPSPAAGAQYQVHYAGIPRVLCT